MRLAVGICWFGTPIAAKVALQKAKFEHRFWKSAQPMCRRTTVLVSVSSRQMSRRRCDSLPSELLMERCSGHIHKLMPSLFRSGAHSMPSGYHKADARVDCGVGPATCQVVLSNLLGSSCCDGRNACESRTGHPLPPWPCTGLYCWTR
jgi:hypothetical protein